jgi:hypothetical protein
MNTEGNVNTNGENQSSLILAAESGNIGLVTTIIAAGHSISLSSTTDQGTSAHVTFANGAVQTQQPQPEQENSR